jgi:shikimate dehydrogenase
MISAKTKICGIFGFPVEHSLSPLMHNAAFKKLGLDYTYLAFNVAPEDLAVAVKSVRALNLAGVNVTIPHKEAVIPFLDELSPEAKDIGAVNTIVPAGCRLIGDNTDGRGFIKSLVEENKTDPRNKKVVLLGAGGAGRAIGVSLVKNGIKKLWLYDVMSEKLGKLALDLSALSKGRIVESISSRQLLEAVTEADILINATPVGMKENDPCVIDPAGLHEKLFVYDIVYNRQTKLLKEAKRRKIRTANGLGMLICQGAIAFELWTGKKAPVGIMKQALKMK